MASQKESFLKGLKDAFPVFIGYFGVSFTVGLTSRNAGLTAFQASLMSFLNTTSAGQAAAINIIRDNGTYSEIILSQIIINLRYLLMSAALSVKIADKSTGKRMLMSLGITDEIFGLSIGQDFPLNPMYTFGCYCIAMPGWVLGTFFGVVLGNALPSVISNSLSMGLYAMFIAIVFPVAAKSRILMILTIVSMTLSWLCSYYIKALSSGLTVIILTVVVASVFAILFPVEAEDKA